LAQAGLIVGAPAWIGAGEAVDVPFAGDRVAARSALDALALPAEQCWYVGDMPGIDVVGARRAGLHAVLMDPLGIHRDADYDRCDSLGELAARIAAI
jgi:hypothetical protein